MFIVCVSVPLAIALVPMLRRACPLRPGLTATLGGPPRPPPPPRC